MPFPIQAPIGTTESCAFPGYVIPDCALPDSKFSGAECPIFAALFAAKVGVLTFTSCKEIKTPWD